MSIRSGLIRTIFFTSILMFVCAAAQSAAADEYIVELYETYCQACHSLEATGAPLAFDSAAWSEILSKGREVAVVNAIKGVGNMPAQGGCMECAYEDFEDLLDYMSKAKSE